jgi:hypothetical protein
VSDLRLSHRFNHLLCSTFAWLVILATRCARLSEVARGPLQNCCLCNVSFLCYNTRSLICVLDFRNRRQPTSEAATCTPDHSPHSSSSFQRDLFHRSKPTIVVSSEHSYCPNAGIERPQLDNHCPFSSTGRSPPPCWQNGPSPWSRAARQARHLQLERPQGQPAAHRGPTVAHQEL